MIATAVPLTQDELRYIVNNTKFDSHHGYLKRYLEMKIKELVRKEGEISVSEDDSTNK
jgi:hypothetical protein